MSNPLNSIPTVELEAGALGAIVENPEKRARIYAVNTLIGLALMAITAALLAGAITAAAAIGSGWHIAAVIPVAALAAVAAAWGSVQPQVSALARANTAPRRVAQVEYIAADEPADG